MKKNRLQKKLNENYVKTSLSITANWQKVFVKTIACPDKSAAGGIAGLKPKFTFKISREHMISFIRNKSFTFLVI